MFHHLKICLLKEQLKLKKKSVIPQQLQVVLLEEKRQIDLRLKSDKKCHMCMSINMSILIIKVNEGMIFH